MLMNTKDGDHAPAASQSTTNIGNHNNIVNPQLLDIGAVGATNTNEDPAYASDLATEVVNNGNENNMIMLRSMDDGGYQKSKQHQLKTVADHYYQDHHHHHHGGMMFLAAASTSTVPAESSENNKTPTSGSCEDGFVGFQQQQQHMHH